jgi:hypothetical protein
VPPGPWDPDIFHDPDTDRWYLYWGSSNYYPLFGIELDKSRRLLYTGEPVPLISLHRNGTAGSASAGTTASGAFRSSRGPG